jgi:UTP--glucose-1-phosphate uridylyltransferase
VRKAVFPAAGLGTRFLPATKAVPKEMLPLVDKPAIQYGIEEAVASGVEDIVIVTAEGKQAIEDHFSAAHQLEGFLQARGQDDELEEIRAIADLAAFSYVRQNEPLGLGHAVMITKDVVGDVPFAVVLPDDIYDASPPALTQLLEVHAELGGPVIAVEPKPAEEISRYGVIGAERIRDRVYRITDLVEKPPADKAPSNLAIVGRYILTPDVFGELEQTALDPRGEIQLTDALKRLLASRPMYAREIDGVRQDTGNKIGFLKAMVYFAARRPDLGEAFRDYLKTIGPA